MRRARHVAALALTVSLSLAAVPAIASDEPDEPMPGRIVLIRNGVLAKFVAKAPVAFDLPDSSNDPTVEGASLTFSDTAGPATDTYTLGSGGWRGLGNPAGFKGYKYKGAGSVSDPCRVVLVKQKVVKAVCKGAGVQMATPFSGDVDIVLTVGTDTKLYCARFGGSEVRNDSTLLKKKSAPAPGTCSPTTTTTPTFTTTTNTGGSSTSTSSSTSTTIGGACCGGMQFSSFIGAGVNADTCGTVRSANGTEYTPVVCGGMYVGGGGNSITLPLSTPNNLHWVVELTGCTGQTATVGPTTSTQTQSVLNCTKAPDCFFGGPLTIPNHATPPASACVIINVATDASGTMNCSSGEAQIDLPLTADIFLTGDSLPLTPGLQPCPLCTGGQVGVEDSGICEGGTNNGMACTPANTDANGVNGMDPSYPTSHDCPPLLSAGIGAIPIGLQLDTGTISWTGRAANNPSSGTQTRVFCGYCRNPDTTGFESPFQPCWENGPVGPACTAPNDVCQQRNQGAFGPNGGGVKTITVVGSAAGSIVDGLPHSQTLASVFCIPPTGNAITDSGADLPAPAAIPLKGMRQLCSTADNCP